MEVKNERIAKVLQSFREAFDEPARKEVYRIFAAYLTEISRLAAGYRTRYEKIEVKEEFFNDVQQLKSFNNRLAELIHKYTLDHVTDQNILQPFEDMLQSASEEVPARINLRETLKFYPLSKNLNIIVALRTIPENTRYLTAKMQQTFVNALAYLRKAPPVKISNQRRRHVPMRNIVLANLGARLTDELSTIFTGVFRERSKYLQALWDFDFEFDERLQKHFLGKETGTMTEVFNAKKEQQFIGDLQQKIADSKIELKKQIDAAFEKAYENIEKQLKKVSTPELPGNRFATAKIGGTRKSATAKFTQNHQRWENTNRAFFNDWAIDVEMVLLYYSVLHNYFELKDRIHDFLDSRLNMNFETLNEFLTGVEERLAARSKSAKSFLAAAKQEREQLNNEFVDKMLADIVENLTSNFSEEIEKFRTKTIQLVENISESRGLIKSRNYDKPISTKDISYISPRELLSFEALPVFGESVQKIKDELEMSLEKARIKLLAAGSVADFALESAMLLFDQKKNAVKTAEKVALDGFERASDLIKEAAEIIAPVRNLPLENLQKAIHEFHADIQKLKDTGNLFDLNLRIAQIKAIDRSKNLRKELLEWFKNAPPRVAALLRNSLENTSENFNTFKEKIGIATPQKRISYEISVFIKQTELALKKLPFVYQRLYQLQPTNEDRFFVNRHSEYKLLNEAFEDWKNERYVSCAIIGEKGSGTTSFINYFLRGCSTELPVKRGVPGKKIYRKTDYLDFFAQLFGEEKFDSNEDLISFINDYETRVVIIIENLHHLFLKKVNGFDCQKMLFDLMANTTRKAFWIGSYTTHSWEFLDKTIRISDHFLIEVALGKLSDNDLQTIIYKRNNLSGYKINFEPPEALIKQKSFAKLDQKTQQSQLEKNFFDNLAALSNGNVSLALLYWLRSTNSVTEDTINIGIPVEMDLSFVKDVTHEYLFALYMMIIHDGLSLEDYAGIFNLPVATCRNTLVPMLEKGLLIRPKEKYNINPIIFRQVTNMLRSRNFIN
jgi:hypothetical protein